jgi:hypothetical protein
MSRWMQIFPKYFGMYGKSIWRNNTGGFRWLLLLGDDEGSQAFLGYFCQGLSAPPCAVIFGFGVLLSLDGEPKAAGEEY